jgi:RNA polymerase sigma-70 factor (ECF subfamily)
VKLDKVDDADLIRLIALADKEISGDALSELYDRYSKLIYSLAIHIVGDRALAEEVIQDVFFRVWDKASTYRIDEAKVNTWLTSIARNRAIDVLRKRSVRPEYYSDRLEISTNIYLQSSDNTESSSEVNMRRERIFSAMNMLPKEQVDALTLSYFFGLSHSQIAEKLNEPLGTIKTRIRLAMQKLKETLVDEQLFLE